jgi:hypothetical protein
MLIGGPQTFKAREGSRPPWVQIPPPPPKATAVAGGGTAAVYLHVRTIVFTVSATALRAASLIAR